MLAIYFSRLQAPWHITIITTAISFSQKVVSINMRIIFVSELQAPRFITLPSASGSVVAEGRTKILQCQALGKSCLLFI